MELLYLSKNTKSKNTRGKKYKVRQLHKRVNYTLPKTKLFTKE